MIVTEYYKTRSDGVVLNRSYSDTGMMIERDGVLYSEAIDPAGSGRTYTESDQRLPDRELTDGEALSILTGGVYGETI